MSSRTRFMLQDLGRGEALTGRRAFEHLQKLYKDWECQHSRPEDDVPDQVWIRAEDEFVRAFPGRISLLLRREPNVEWQGPGPYRQVPRKELSEQGPVQAPMALPEGPKWLRALEMWKRLEPTHNKSYHFWVSRDNRRQSWRKSLCNPFYQNWGFKIFLTKTASRRKPDRQTTAPNRSRWTIRDEEGFPDQAIPGNPPPGNGKPIKTAKPAVGIWS